MEPSKQEMKELTQKIQEAYAKITPEILNKTLINNQPETPTGLVNLASMIDHTLLKQDAVPSQIKKLCEEALEYKFASVCVNPTHVKQCAGILKGSSVKVCTVIGFPLGANLPIVKWYEAARMMDQGAQELDMVINIGSLKSGNVYLVTEDILGVVKQAHEQNVLVKVIIETALLSLEEKIMACLVTREAGADFVKSSTGFASGGAKVEDIQLMCEVVGSRMGVKAAGGIRTRQDALAMVGAGATRIGASAGIQIIKEDPSAENNQPTTY